MKTSLSRLQSKIKKTKNPKRKKTLQRKLSSLRDQYNRLKKLCKYRPMTPTPTPVRSPTPTPEYALRQVCSATGRFESCYADLGTCEEGLAHGRGWGEIETKATEKAVLNCKEKVEFAQRVYISWGGAIRELQICEITDCSMDYVIINQTNQ